jgi:hypothetical protein
MSLLVTKGHRVTLPEIEALPEPEALGPRHKPYHLAEVVKTLHRVAEENEFDIVGEDYALARKDGMLLGVLQLEKEKGFQLGGLEAKPALGFRSSVNQITSLNIVAGGAVMVCDNMVLSGKVTMVVKKHTLNMNLLDQVRIGFSNYLGQQTILEEGVKKLQTTELTDTEAKAMVYDSVVQHEIPGKLLKNVNEWYFEKRPEDCDPRTAWGLHNSFTRAFKTYTSFSQFEHTRSLGELFGLGKAA